MINLWQKLEVKRLTSVLKLCLALSFMIRGAVEEEKNIASFTCRSLRRPQSAFSKYKMNVIYMWVAMWLSNNVFLKTNYAVWNRNFYAAKTWFHSKDFCSAKPEQNSMQQTKLQKKLSSRDVYGCDSFSTNIANIHFGRWWGTSVNLY